MYELEEAYRTYEERKIDEGIEIFSMYFKQARVTFNNLKINKYICKAEKTKLKNHQIYIYIRSSKQN